MSNKYSLSGTWALKNESGQVIAQGSQEYLNLEYDDVVLVQNTIAGSLQELSKQKAKEKK